jgi:hypothetical protein
MPYTKLAFLSDIPSAYGATPAAVDGGAAAVGASTSFAPGDHKHGATTGAPVDIASANSGGSGTALALANHIHNHPVYAAGDLHTPYVKADGTRAFTGPQSFGLQQITNVVVEQVAALPGTLTPGRVVQLTTDGHLYIGV